jgi:predicted dehydrogenase
MKKLRAAVIGVGYLGNFHAQKYAGLDLVDLVAVSDNDPARCSEIAAQLGTAAVTDYRALVGRVDLVSIVVPTVMHHEVAAYFLNHGVHVLLEKPITTTVAQARDLIGIAARNRLVFQVGHLERFNPALDAVRGIIKKPGFIDATRVAPYKPRGTDVSIVLDLMVHDLDIISTIIGSEVRRISASGACVYSSTPDIANARIEFENGAVANVTASRISFHSDRSIRFFQSDAYIAVDFQNRTASVCRKGEADSSASIPVPLVEEIAVPQRDQILAEIEAFIDSVLTGTPPVVSGQDGTKALEIALLIEEKIAENIALLQSGSEAE